MNRETDILVIGGGFAGFSCFRALDRMRRDVCLLTDRNHFLFSPLLPLAAVGSVEVRSIVESIHRFEKKPGEVCVGRAVDIDPQSKTVSVLYEGGGRGEIRYRDLVLAPGAVTSTFGIPGVEEHAFFMREMKHARRLRETLLKQFEQAASRTGDERRNAVRFLVIGAGATGVETACEIHDLVHQDLKRFFPEAADECRIEIIEATRDILPAFDRTLAAYARMKLKQKGIRLRTETKVESVDASGVRFADGGALESRVILWTTGNTAGGFVRRCFERLGIAPGPGGRIPVDEFLRVQGCESIHAIGDCAAAPGGDGGFLPATAQVAMKQGFYIGALLNGRKRKPFHFRSMGMLASLGSGSAIADLGMLRFKGLFAWWFWKAAYLTRLVSARNKVSVALDWIKLRFCGRNTARIEF